MACKWVIGASSYLDVAHEAWSRAFPDLRIAKVIITQDTHYRFNLEPLDALDPADGTAFVALDERFGNFKRVELMQMVMERGFKLESFISPYAMLAGDVQVGPNAFVGDGVIAGPGSRIGYNSVLRPGVQVGSSVHIRPSCWLDSGVIVGDGVQFGAHCTVRSGAVIAPHVQIGRNCELGWPRRYDKDLAPKTIYDTRYDAPIYTYDH